MDSPLKETRITDLKEDDRPREKAMAHGIASLSDAELLTIAIGSGLPGRSALSVARAMLSAVDGKLSGIRSQSIHALIKNNPGIGQPAPWPLPQPLNSACDAAMNNVPTDRLR